jgi:hypothetical protein
MARRWSVPYSAGNPRVAGTRNGVDDARCPGSFARFRGCWTFSRNKALRFARNIRRIALARHCIWGGSGRSRGFRSSARGMAVSLWGQVSVVA